MSTPPEIRFRGGERGGLSAIVLPRPLPSANSPGLGMRTPQEGDAFIAAEGELDRLRLNPTYIGFLVYIGVITTYALPLGDVAVIIALIGLPMLKDGVRIPPILAGFSLFLLWISIGYTQSAFPTLVTSELQNLAKLGLILLAAVNALQTRSQLRFFIIFWLGCFALYPLRGTLINYFVGGYTTFGRALWNYIYANPNDLAALTLLQLSMCTGVLASERNRWFRRAALLGVLLLVLLIVLTQSRGGLLGLAVFGTYALSGNHRKIKSLGLGVVVVLVVLMFAPASVWERIGGLRNATNTEELSTVDEEGSAEQRWQIWQTSFLIIRDHPVFGVGWGAYPAANSEYAPMSGGGEFRLGARDTHSTYLNVLAETGYPGLALFLTLVGGTVLYVDRTRRAHRNAFPRAAIQLYFLEIGLLSFLVSGIFGSYSRLSFFYIHLVLMWALAQALQRDAEKLARGRAHSMYSPIVRG